MNGNHRIYGRAGLWASCAFLGVLTGCTTYVEAPRPSPVYAEPPPPAEVREIVVTPPPPVETVVEIRTERDFDQPLSPYGHWVEVADYGRCWVPNGVDRDWRPYTNGHWQNTEAGWYWVSDEPWGWATYHYGRWDWRSEVGWLWVPQTQWAPAWVSFHQGGGYTGWAPLHPSARIRDNGLEEPVRPDRDRERGLVFVEQRHFLEPVRPTTVVVNNTTIINQMVNITSIKVVNNTIINEGPHIDVIEKASGRTVQAVPVRELRRKQEAAVVVARPILPANQNAGPANGRPENNSRDFKTQKEAERRATEAQAQAQAETQRKTKEAELKAAQAEAQRRTDAANAQAQAQAEAKTAQAEAARRAEAANLQTQAEAQRKAKEAELKAAQAEAQRRTNAMNAQAQVEAQRKASEIEAKTAQAEAARHAEAANSQAQAETQRKAKEAELKAAQVEAERQPSGARENVRAENQKNPAARGEDAITSRIVATLAADPTLRDVHVTRSNGFVHLNGTVSSAEQKKRAGDLAQKIETSHPVQNNLTVRP